VFVYNMSFVLKPSSELFLHALIVCNGRCVVYPLLMRAGRSTPCSMFLVAMMLCSYNGLLQTRWLLNVAVYPPSWTTSTTFLSGELTLSLQSHWDRQLSSRSNCTRPHSTL